MVISDLAMMRNGKDSV